MKLQMSWVKTIEWTLLITSVRWMEWWFYVFKGKGQKKSYHPFMPIYDDTQNNIQNTSKL